MSQNRPDVVTSASLAQRWRQRGQRLAKEPFAGQDREGRLPLAELADAEARAARSTSPKGKQWPELQRFDERVLELQSRQRDVTAALTELRDKRASAPGAVLDALAAWQLGDQQGARPESSVDAIDDEIADLQADFDGLTRAVDKVLEDKSAFVERHRGRLVKAADTAAQDAALRLIALIDEVEAARTNLIDLRASAVWASLYPQAEAGQAPTTQQIHGGVAKPIQAAIGVAVAVQASRVFDLLRSDARWLRSAMTTGQAAKMIGATSGGDAVWNDSAEGIEFERTEQKAKLDEYERMWGSRPGEFDLISRS